MSRMSLKSAKFRVDRLDIRNSTAGLRTLRLFRSFCSTRRLRLEHTTKRLRRWKSWRMIAESIVALSMFSSSWRVSKRKCLTDSKRLKLRCDISTMISLWITRMRATASKRPARNSQETRETRLVSKKGPDVSLHLPMSISMQASPDCPVCDGAHHRDLQRPIRQPEDCQRLPKDATGSKILLEKNYINIY